MATKLEQLLTSLKASLGDKITKHIVAFNEVTIECKAADYLNVCQTLRDDAALKFEQLIDLSGVDYQ
ncbi:MAG: NADH-quinone oxidoreductase subunit C, partial [Methylotenera sp.]|nr:NADH-quinone oxidoreductase subunit C [Methylotenera sp.]